MRTSLAALLALLPGLARAQTVDATAQTLLIGRQDPRDGTVHTVVPAYESISIVATGLDVSGVEGTRVLISGWGMLAAGEPRDDRATGDLDLAFIEGRLLDRRLALRAGRQLIASGVARNLQLDGLDAVVRAPYGIGVEAYGGVPVTTRFGSVSDDGAFGGRLFWRPAPRFEGGVSFIDVVDDGRIDRQEAGIDARLVVADSLTLTGLAALSTVETRLAEAAVRALWQPRRDLELTVEASRTAPDLFLSRGSIFSVFAEETHDEAGATIYLRPFSSLRLWGDGYAISDEAGVGGRGGLRLGWTLDRAAATVLGVEGRVLSVPDHGYQQARVYVVRRFGSRFVATLDADAYRLDPTVNGQGLSLTGTATLAWDFLPGWRAVATALGGETPELSSRFEAMAKLVYNFQIHAVQR